MSADNFLGIYKFNGVYYGRGCWAECERSCCGECSHPPVFKTSSLEEAVRLAEDALKNDIYEYGYAFLNLPEEGKTMTDLKEERMEKFWVCYVEGTNGGKHHRHFELPLAEKEAERLARLEGKAVYIFECIGKCEVPVMWVHPEVHHEWEVPR